MQDRGGYLCIWCLCLKFTERDCACDGNASIHNIDAICETKSKGLKSSLLKCRSDCGVVRSSNCAQKSSAEAATPVSFSNVDSVHPDHGSVVAPPLEPTHAPIIQGPITKTHDIALAMAGRLCRRYGSSGSPVEPITRRRRR